MIGNTGASVEGNVKKCLYKQGNRRRPKRGMNWMNKEASLLRAWENDGPDWNVEFQAATIAVVQSMLEISLCFVRHCADKGKSSVVLSLPLVFSLEKLISFFFLKLRVFTETSWIVHSPIYHILHMNNN